MTVRTISPEELHWFANLSGDDWLAGHIREWWQTGQSAPNRCFVAEQDGKPVGRVLFFSFDSSPEMHVMFGLHLDWETDCLEVGADLLRHALARIQAMGAKSAEHRVYDIYAKSLEKQRRLVEAIGFRLIQDKRRFVRNERGAMPVPNRLVFRTLAQAGESEYVAAVRRVTAGTLDRELQREVEGSGPARAAREYVDGLKDLEVRPDWWQLGYLPDGSLCGLVVPQRLHGEEGCINYIGVVPELRGSGYGLDLLLKGTALLQEAGLKQVVAEIDSLNRPLAAHLAQAGYRHDGTLWCYRCDLAPAPPPKGS